MLIHPNWSTEAFDLPTVSPLVGPFPGRRWLETWWNHRGSGALILAIADDSLLPLTLNDNRLEFAGEGDLTDYHSPLGTATALVGVVADLPDATEIHLDSMPEESAAAVATALRDAELEPAIAEHAVTAVLELPDTFDDYLAGLVKKERHELRRKRRKFDAELGAARIERRSGTEAVALFASLHRQSDGVKGTFMTEGMEQFFLGLHTDAGGVIDVLVDGSGRPAAAIFSFEDEAGFYLYNSAFKPELRNLSPGNVVLSHLIERSIAEEKQVFDFLKGGEAYKFRLGAAPRPLFAVTATKGKPE
ncbi:MAG: GNAT family N-acetyltransferase [bacterium]|nr:GNAT family N-acetyltransferase [bacterium]